MPIPNEIKQERLKNLREEYKRLTLEWVALIDAWQLNEVEQIADQRLEITKRIDELEECLSTTKKEAEQK